MPVLNFSINGKKAVSGAKQVVKALSSIGSKAKSIISTAINPLTAAIGAFAGFQAVKGLITTADAYTTLAAQLEYVTGSAEGAAKAQDDLYKMSQKSRTSVTENAAALVRLSQANEMTGLTTEQNIKVLGGLNALMLRTGTSGASASAAMLQLTQALASGSLAGDEFKSIAENAPAVMAEFAKSLGVPRGELKQMAADGKITSAVMVEALNKIADAGEQSFADLPRTAESGWQLVVNAFERAWGKINVETGIMGLLFQGLERLAFWIENNTDTFSRWAEVMASRLVENWPAIKGFFQGVYDWLIRMFQLVYDNRDGILGFFSDMGTVIVSTYNAIRPVVVWLIEKLGQLSNLANYTPLAALARAAGTIAGGGGLLDAATSALDADNSSVSSGSSSGSSSSSSQNTGQSTSDSWWSGSESESLRGVSIINNFTQKLNKTDVVSITKQQARLTSRL